jgi:DNA-binding PadR family transcriptional regulator
MIIVFHLSGFQRDILYIVAGNDEPHGLQIKNELESVYEEDINHGRLYPNLDTLVEEGLIEKGSIDKRTNSYAITDKGKSEITARLEWESEYIG